MRVLSTTFLIILAIHVNGQDTVRVTGEIFNFKPGPQFDTLDINSKSVLETTLNLYNEKKDVIRNFLLTRKKDYKEANKILKNDKKLNKLDVSIIAATFETGVFNDLGILYKGIFETKDQMNQQIVIACSSEQQRDIDKYYKTEQTFIFRCKYLGDLIATDIKIYELIDYELTRD